MAVGVRLVSDVLRIMRIAISKRNENDPDATDTVLFSYINDFISLKMGSDVALFEQFGALEFSIDDSVDDGVYTFNDVGASSDFMFVSNDALISIADPLDESTSWSKLNVFRNPEEFFMQWGFNNKDVLVAGYPTEVLIFENTFTFRTIPEQEYLVKMFGYKKINDFADTTDPLLFDYWLRYLAYGAALDYVTDYNYSAEKVERVRKAFSSERKYLLTQNHNNLKYSRGKPSF